jgi:hypothetical protein
VPIVVTGLVGVAALVAHLTLSRPTVPHREEIALAERAQALPSAAPIVPARRGWASGGPSIGTPRRRPDVRA